MRALHTCILLAGCTTAQQDISRRQTTPQEKSDDYMSQPLCAEVRGDYVHPEHNLPRTVPIRLLAFEQGLRRSQVELVGMYAARGETVSDDGNSLATSTQFARSASVVKAVAQPKLQGTNGVTDYFWEDMNRELALHWLESAAKLSDPTLDFATTYAYVFGGAPINLPRASIVFGRRAQPGEAEFTAGVTDRSGPQICEAFHFVIPRWQGAFVPGSYSIFVTYEFMPGLEQGQFPDYLGIYDFIKEGLLDTGRTLDTPRVDVPDDAAYAAIRAQRDTVRQQILRAKPFLVQGRSVFREIKMRFRRHEAEGDLAAFRDDSPDPPTPHAFMDYEDAHFVDPPEARLKINYGTL